MPRFLTNILQVSRAGTFIGIMLISTAWAQTFTVIHPFTYEARPTGALSLDASGRLYGATESGRIWRLTRNADGIWSSAILHLFDTVASDPGGKFPMGGVILDSAGNLYGTAYQGGLVRPSCNPEGCGVVFKLSPNADGTWTYKVLHQFTGPDGYGPESRLTLDAAGNLYGTTPYASTGSGVVFKLSPNADGTWTESTIHIFGGADGALPYAGVILDRAGNLYGTTSEGGAYGGAAGYGVVYKLAPNSDGTWTESVLWSFMGPPDGQAPNSDLMIDASGDLDGTASQGGSLEGQCDSSGTGCGVVFQLSPNPDGTWKESILHDFDGADGFGPQYGLVSDSTGSLYGTTEWGGAFSDCYGTSCGVVFKLTQSGDGWADTVLHSFSGYGRDPGPLLLDPSGNLYGTTFDSTGTIYGLVFEITP